jgi:hypothetical protein
LAACAADAEASARAGSQESQRGRAHGCRVVRKSGTLVAGGRRGLLAWRGVAVLPVLELLQELVGFLAGEAPPVEFRHGFVSI